MVTPELVTTQPGGGYDDIVGLALLLSCAGILINTHAGADRWRLSGIGIAALAAGLAAGTKFTFLVPAAALTVGILVVARRGNRIKEGAVWLALVVLSGGFWYVRNWVVVGNPLPSVHLKLGPLSLPNPIITTPSSTLAHFILKGSDWSSYFFPGFRLAFGPVWWAVLGLSAVGLLVALIRGQGSMTKMLAAVGIVTAAGFVVSPQYLTAFGAPVFFVDNIRYADPAIVLGLVLLPLSRDLVSPRWRWCLLLTFVGITLVTQLDESTWPLHLLHATVCSADYRRRRSSRGIGRGGRPGRRTCRRRAPGQFHVAGARDGQTRCRSTRLRCGCFRWVRSPEILLGPPL